MMTTTTYVGSYGFFNYYPHSGYSPGSTVAVVILIDVICRYAA